MSTWQLQQAKQQFSEVVRRAHDDGPQIVSRHGRDVVVVIAVEDYERLRGRPRDFKQFLTGGPDPDALEIVRSPEAPRPIDLGDGA
jgi:prevent-host-death family protein